MFWGLNSGIFWMAARAKSCSTGGRGQVKGQGGKVRNERIFWMAARAKSCSTGGRGQGQGAGGEARNERQGA